MKRTHFIVEKEENIAKVVINRPERKNAFLRHMWTDFADILRELESDRKVRVIVITGAGDQSFVSGADISEMTGEFPALVKTETVNPVASLTRVIENMEKVVIAMINGYALGGGCQIALACDLRVASSEAQLGIPSAKIGICLSFENIKRVVDLVGPGRAKDILFTGRRIASREALSIGLVDYVVPHQDLASFTADLADTIARNAPLSVLGAKKTINTLARNYNLREIEDEFAVSRACYLSEDFQEGVRAFLEKRKPEFQGR
jgi:enoyl-CoA hydratase/carnithine racemase